MTQFDYDKTSIPVPGPELDSLKVKLEDKKKELMITPGVELPSLGEVTFELLIEKYEDVIRALSQIKPPDAGHLNNLGCALLYRKEIGCEDARDNFLKALEAKDFPKKDGTARSHAETNLTFWEEICELYDKIKKLEE